MQPAGEQKVEAPGILLATRDAGRSKQDPDTGEYQHGCSGAPHSESAGVVQRHRWAEKNSDGGVFDKCPQPGLIEYPSNIV